MKDIDYLTIADYGVETLTEVLKKTWQGKQANRSIYNIRDVTEVYEKELIVDVIVEAPQYGKVLGGPMLMIGSAKFRLNEDGSIEPSLALAFTHKALR